MNLTWGLLFAKSTGATSSLSGLAEGFAIPLTNIYKEILRTGIWPLVWKEESVTVIPKKSNPATVNDLHNISCTMLASKMYESYILEWLQKQVKLKNNQYGGVKGRSADHMLIAIWQKTLYNVEDCRAGSVVTSINFAKAFNRLSFKECLIALARKGASSNLLRVVASFLSVCLLVRVKQAWWDPLPVFGGVPQGSILGVFLFNATTDNLEDGTGVDDQTDDAADWNSSEGDIPVEDDAASLPSNLPISLTLTGSPRALLEPASPLLPPGYVPVSYTHLTLPTILRV